MTAKPRKSAATTVDEDDKPVRKLSVAAADAQAEALEQAAEYDSIFGEKPLALDDGSVMMIPPHPSYGMLDDEKMEEWDELMFRVDTAYDREPDIYVPEQVLETEAGVKLTLPAETKRGDLKLPYRVNNELVRPPHQIKVVQLALGDEEYARLRKGGRNASDVWKIWNRNSLEMRERQQRDSKSASSTVDLAPVPPPDSE